MNYHKGFIAPLLLALIAFLFLGGGAYVYMQKNQTNQSATATSTTQTSNNVETKTLIVDPKTVKIGDVVGNWTVSSIDKLSFYPDGSPASGYIFFTGSAVVTGVVGVNDMTGAMTLAPTPVGGAQIPVFKGFNDKPENKTFAFSGDMQKLSSSVGQNTTVEIGNFGVSFMGKGGSGPFAKLVRIVQATSTVPAPITVTYPNGGESFSNDGKGGPIATVTWTSANFDSRVSIHLIASDGTLTAVISDNAPNTGSYAWIFDPRIPSGNYKIRLSGADRGSPGTDESDGYFKISPNSQTGDWITYTNSQYGFELKYPSELKLSERPGSTWTNVDLKKAGFQLTFFAGEQNIGGYIGYGTVWAKKISIDSKLVDETLTKCEGNDVMIRIANMNFNGQTRYDRFESECFDESLISTLIPQIEAIATTLKYSK